MFLEKPDPTEKRGRSRRNRWTIPPIPVGSVVDLEGVEVLDDLPSALGLELFERLRDVRFWISVPEAFRSQLFVRGRGTFAPTADIPDRVRDAVVALRRVAGQPRATISPEVVATACGAVSSWAYDSGLMGTAISFAHVAARVLPDSPEAAFAVARATRDAGRHSHSDAWFQRTLGLARRVRSAELKARVYIGWGLSEELRGDQASAKRKFEKALTTATEASLPSLAAHAHQFLIPLTQRSFDEAFSHAVAAARLYSDDDPDLPRLASDTGALFSDHGFFGLALELYEAALPRFMRPADLLACYANIGRASAALAQKQKFSAAWTDFERLSRAPVGQFHAESLLELAAGAVTLRYWKAAVKMVTDARIIAERLGMARTMEKITLLLDTIARREGGDINREPGPELVEFADRLRNRLLQSRT